MLLHPHSSVFNIYIIHILSGILNVVLKHPSSLGVVSTQSLSVTMSSCQSGYSDRIARLKDRIFDLAETKQVYLHPVSDINLLPSSQPTKQLLPSIQPSNPATNLQRQICLQRTFWTSAGILKKLEKKSIESNYTAINVKC